MKYKVRGDHNIYCKSLLQGTELQEKEAQKDLKHTGNLFRKNLHLKDVGKFQA